MNVQIVLLGISIPMQTASIVGARIATLVRRIIGHGKRAFCFDEPRERLTLTEP